jgi:hypothetical protein
MKPDDMRFLKEPTQPDALEMVRRDPVTNIPSEDDPLADDDVLERALLRHCQTSDETSNEQVTISS